MDFGPLFLRDAPDVRKAGGNMSRRDEYEQKAEALLAPIVEGQGFELVDVEYVKEAGNWYLRGYIDKPGGITVNDCEAVSRAFSDKLDENDYTLSLHDALPISQKEWTEVHSLVVRYHVNLILAPYFRKSKVFFRSEEHTSELQSPR